MEVVTPRRQQHRMRLEIVAVALNKHTVGTPQSNMSNRGNYSDDSAMGRVPTRTKERTHSGGHWCTLNKYRVAGWRAAHRGAIRSGNRKWRRGAPGQNGRPTPATAQRLDSAATQQIQSPCWYFHDVDQPRHRTITESQIKADTVPWSTLSVYRYWMRAATASSISAGTRTRGPTKRMAFKNSGQRTSTTTTAPQTPYQPCEGHILHTDRQETKMEAGKSEEDTTCAR